MNAWNFFLQHTISPDGLSPPCMNNVKKKGLRLAPMVSRCWGERKKQA